MELNETATMEKELAPLGLRYVWNQPVRISGAKNMTKEQMDMSQRDERIYSLGVQGASLSEIAKKFNLSRERVRQIYSEMKNRKENYDSWPPLKKILSCRAQNALVGHFNDEAILGNPQKISEIGRDEIVRIKNIGIKSMRELASALNSLGFINCEKSWLSKDIVQD